MHQQDAHVRREIIRKIAHEDVVLCAESDTLSVNDVLHITHAVQSLTTLQLLDARLGTGDVANPTQEEARLDTLARWFRNPVGKELDQIRSPATSASGEQRHRLCRAIEREGLKVLEVVRPRWQQYAILEERQQLSRAIDFSELRKRYERLEAMLQGRLYASHIAELETAKWRLNAQQPAHRENAVALRLAPSDEQGRRLVGHTLI